MSGLTTSESADGPPRTRDEYLCDGPSRAGWRRPRIRARSSDRRGDGRGSGR